MHDGRKPDSRLLPHQGCVITRTAEGIDIAGSAMNSVMSAGVAPLVYRAHRVPCRLGKTDSTNLRMHWHRGELIFNWEVNVRELRIHDPPRQQHGLQNEGFITTHEWHDVAWEIRLDRMRVTVDGEMRFEGPGNYSGMSPALGGPVSAARSRYTSFRSSPLT